MRNLHKGAIIVGRGFGGKKRKDNNSFLAVFVREAELMGT